MSNAMRIIIALAVLGSALMVVNQIRQLMRQRRNLRHWERGEPLEKTDLWD